ncbi:MAG: hypothetical protein AAB295_12990 [Chloroflexota bacterium]
MKQVRALIVGLTLALAGLAGAPTTAIGSCRPPDLADQIARAEVIAYGTVTETRQTFAPTGGVIKFRPERVLKGTLTSVVEVNLGPGRGGAVTSVDYMAATRGDGHTLYLRRVEGGAYETDACSGSHAGVPTPEEEKALGTGTPVAPVSDKGVWVAVADGDGISPVLLGALVALMALVGVVAALALRRRAQPR